MSVLTDFAKNHKKEGAKIRSAITATDNAYLKAGLSICGLMENRDYTMTHYDEEMPVEMQALFRGIRPEIKHMYCLFDGPFEAPALRKIKQLSLDDPETIALIERQNTDMENYSEPIVL